MNYEMTLDNREAVEVCNQLHTEVMERWYAETPDDAA